MRHAAWLSVACLSACCSKCCTVRCKCCTAACCTSHAAQRRGGPAPLHAAHGRARKQVQAHQPWRFDRRVPSSTGRARLGARRFRPSLLPTYVPAVPPHPYHACSTCLYHGHSTPVARLEGRQYREYSRAFLNAASATLTLFEPSRAEPRRVAATPLLFGQIPSALPLH
jgi:hypothetical protein